MTASLTCPMPQNINPLSPNGFQFSIQKLPDVSFFTQSVNLPGLMLGEPEFANPFVKQPIPGESIVFDQLQVQFIVDEGMENYLSLYNWIIALGFPQNYEQYAKFISESQKLATTELSKNYSDGFLTILGSNNQPVQTVQ